MTVQRIEDLLRWTFVIEMTRARRDGLPRSTVASSNWRMIERIGSLGTLIDEGHGPVSVATEEEPHPDAVTTAEAVAALDDMVVIEGADHDLLAGWPDFGVAGEEAIERAWASATRIVEGRRVLRSSLAALVRSVGVLGEWPDWRGEEPMLVDEVNRYGKPVWWIRTRTAVRWDEAGKPLAWADVEIDGFDRRRRRPKAGAYRRQILSPDPVAILERRIRYGLVHAALRDLAERLDGLGGRTLVGPLVSPTPWAEVRS